MTSEWAVAALQLGTFSGDEFWDQTVLCINANKYAWDGSRKIVDEKGNGISGIFGATKTQIDSNSLPLINFNGTTDYFTIEDTPNLSFLTRNFTFEFFKISAQINRADEGSNA